MAVWRNDDLNAEQILESRRKPFVSCCRPLKENFILTDFAVSDDSVEIVFRNGIKHGRNDFLFVETLLQERADILLHKDCAAVACSRRNNVFCHFSDQIYRDLKLSRLFLDERAGSCRADIVHVDFFGHSVFETDEFRILAADLENCFDFGEHRRRSSRVSCDFIDYRICSENYSGKFSAGSGRSESADLRSLGNQ